jgi:hypothetical protein
LLVVNAQHLKAVPGRKTDVRDAEWIAELLAHGLLRGGFVPPASVRELRELTRYRTSLVRDRARTINRLQKVLEAANIKLANVVSDIDGVSARLMLEALVAGERDAQQLAGLAKGRLKDKRAQLVEALSGRLQPHQSFLIAEELAQIDYLDGAIERLNHEVEERLRPFRIRSTDDDLHKRSQATERQDQSTRQPKLGKPAAALPIIRLPFLQVNPKILKNFLCRFFAESSLLLNQFPSRFYQTAGLSHHVVGLLLRMFSEHAEGYLCVLESGACKKKFTPQFEIHGEVIIAVKPLDSEE